MASVTNSEHVKSIFIRVREEDTVISTSRGVVSKWKKTIKFSNSVSTLNFAYLRNWDKLQQPLGKQSH